MPLLSIPGLETAYHATSQTKVLWKAFLIPVAAVQQRLCHSMTGHHPEPIVDNGLLRQSHSFTMLVESDVKEGMSGL